MPAFRAVAARGPRPRPRDARRRRPDRGRQPRPRLAARTPSAFALDAPRPPPVARRDAGRRPPDPVTNPLSADHSVLRRRSSAASSRSSATNLRHGRDDVAIFEIGKGYGDDGGVDPRVVAARRSRSPARPRSRPGTGRARPSTSTTRRASIELVCRRLGFDGADVRAARPTSRCSTRAGPPGSTATGDATARSGRSAGVVGELHPRVADDGRPARRPADRRRARRRGPRRRPPGGSSRPRRRRATRPPSATSRSSSRSTSRRPTSRPRSAPPPAEHLRRPPPVRHLPRRAARGRREEPRLAAASSRPPDRTLTEAEVEAAIAAITAALGRDRRPNQDLRT